MKFLDILGMSVSNLWRRKLRTFLTVLGVVIGTTSVVVMMSLGVGLKSSLMSEAESYGGMTQIMVQANYWGENITKDQLLSDTTVNTILNLDYVESVDPELAVNVSLIQGKYTAYISILGVSQETLNKITMAEGGKVPSPTAPLPELIIGNTVVCDFYVTSTYVYEYYEKGEVPDVDLTGKTLYTKFEDSYVDDGSGNTTVIPGKKSIFPVAGVVDGDITDYGTYCSNAYTDIDSLKSYLAKHYKNAIIPGQPVDKSGKPFKDLAYTALVVNVDTTENVDTVMEQIQDMGFKASNNKEWIEQTQGTMSIVQAVLGGIGGISLLVAAIGIANTMMMSIYERTKEIGVIKVLGCSLGNIRMMFLTEAGFIGFLGGATGLVFSFILSAIVNVVGKGYMSYMVGTTGGKLSVIPIWLVLLALIFSTLIGMLAGFMPAQRATKLSPLAAIRND